MRFDQYNSRICAGALVILSFLLGTVSVALSEDAQKPIHLAIEGNRGPFAIAFTPDGARAIVTEFDEGAVALIDRASGAIPIRLGEA